MLKKRPVLRYFGGKWKLADWIIENMPEHRIYVEPFGGAASVLMKKPRSYAEVYNDIDDSVYNLFGVLRITELSLCLQKALSVTPFSRREFELAHTYHPDPVEKARRLIIRSFMGFGPDSATNIESKTGFRSNSNRSGSTPAHDWIRYPEQIMGFTQRLQGVVIENRDAFVLMKQHDSEKTLFYLDPPYPTDTRRGGKYKHEMTNEDHQRLADFVTTLKGNVMISGYDHEIYNSLGWYKITRQSRADKAGLRTEVLWIKKPKALNAEADHAE